MDRTTVVRQGFTPLGYERFTFAPLAIDDFIENQLGPRIKAIRAAIGESREVLTLQLLFFLWSQAVENHWHAQQLYVIMFSLYTDAIVLEVPGHYNGDGYAYLYGAVFLIPVVRPYSAPMDILADHAMEFTASHTNPQDRIYNAITYSDYRLFNSREILNLADTAYTILVTQLVHIIDRLPPSTFSQKSASLSG